MITIHGLTRRQHELMDRIWELESLDEVHAYIESLDNLKDQWDARALVWVATMEVEEHEGGLNGSKTVYNDLMLRLGVSTSP